MRVRVLAFARLGELLGGGSHDLTIADGASAAAVWDRLAADHPDLRALAESTRLARNGRVLDRRDETLADGDELALLPPVGGG